MGASARIAKWGSSLAVRIPKPLAEQWGVSEGSQIELLPSGDQVVLRKKSYDLEEMLADVTPDKLHSEWDAGPSQGGEEW